MDLCYDIHNEKVRCNYSSVIRLNVLRFGPWESYGAERTIAPKKNKMEVRIAEKKNSCFGVQFLT